MNRWLDFGSTINEKVKDFEHLLFNSENAGKILRIGAFIDGLYPTD
jgi:hypothetical protein